MSVVRCFHCGVDRRESQFNYCRTELRALNLIPTMPVSTKHEFSQRAWKRTFEKNPRSISENFGHKKRFFGLLKKACQPIKPAPAPSRPDVPAPGPEWRKVSSWWREHIEQKVPKPDALVLPTGSIRPRPVAAGAGAPR